MPPSSPPRLALRTLPHPIAGLIALLWIFAGPALAAPVPQLYSAEVAVAEQTAEERNQAIERAFAKVLVKVTGNPSIVSRPGLGTVMRQAPRYVQQYRYRLAPAAGSATEQEQRLLWVQFDGAGVQRLLRDNGLPVWGENRPLVLVWLAAESGGKRRLVLPDSIPELTGAVQLHADERGIPLLFPLMDLEDQNSLQASDLWGGFSGSIEQASERYRPDLILVGRVSLLSRGRWRARWSLYQDGEAIDWQADGEGPEAVAAQGISRVADRLADRYAPGASETGMSEALIAIAAVHTMADHVAALRYLRSQSAVEAIETVAVEPDAATFRLRYRGALSTLERELELGGLLRPDRDAAPLPLHDPGSEPEPELTLFYRLRE